MLDFVVSPSAASPPLAHTTVSWQPHAHFRCFIHSNDAEVIERARLLFAASICASAAAPVELPSAPHLAWSIERPTEGERWYADRLTDITPALEGQSLQSLLANIEYAALGALLSRGTESFFALHASLLSKAGRSVIIVGPKEAGKSTLACALWTRCGWRLECDDSVLIGTAIGARPNPRRVSLRNGSRSLLGEELWLRLLALPSTLPLSTGLLFHPHELEAAPPKPSAASPSAVFFLARRESSAGSAQAVPIPPAQAALSLLPYSTLLLPRGEEQLNPARVDWGQSLPRLTQFAAHVPAFDLGRGPLDDMTRAIEHLVFHANPVSASAS